MKKQQLFWTLCMLVVILLASGIGPQRAAAQDPVNLLANGALEAPYYGQGSGTRTAPQGWSLWVGAGAPEAFPHSDKLQVRDGAVSWNIKQGFNAFTAAGFQRVSGLKKGDGVLLKAYGWLYTCNDTANSCIIEQAPFRRSDTSAGASLKVGIDPTGGTDPNSAAIKWSAPASPYDQWAEMSIAVTAEGDAVTVFLYATQAKGLALNNVYWDAASLTMTSGAPPGSTPVPPTAAEVPFVKPQGVRPDGSIVHTVQEGDTLSSIAFAYNQDYGATVQSIADLNERIETNTRFLIIGEEIIILPPGSVDPATGKVIPAADRTRSATTGGTPAAGTPQASLTPGGDQAALTPTPGTETTEVATEPPADSAQPAVPAATEAVTEPAAEPTEQAQPTEQAPAVQATEPAVEQPAVTEPAAAEPTSTIPMPTEIAQVAATTGKLCVSVYNDANQNLMRDADETALTGSSITLSQANTADTTYDYADDPLCMDMPPGSYQVSAVPPQGYGMTTAAMALVSLVSGRQVTVAFGGAEGYTPPAAPAGDQQPTAEQIVGGAVAPVVEVVVNDQEEDKDILDRLYDNSGLIVLGFAGVVIVSGAVLLLALRRFTR